MSEVTGKALLIWHLIAFATLIIWLVWLRWWMNTRERLLRKELVTLCAVTAGKLIFLVACIPVIYKFLEKGT